MSTPDRENTDFEMLLEYLKHNRSFDFTGYKRSTLERRIQKRMQVVEVANYTDYVDYLEVHPDEFIQLFNTILINVTCFFRDPKTWEYINETIIPRILASKKPGAPIRIWSAGCASGEETYTIAILLAEHLGIEGFKELVKIYATDLDEEALVKALMASYSESDMETVPPPLVDKYFERIGNRYVFLRDLRRSVIFGRHDLVQDAPISRIDLLICRNVLMYFNTEAQSRILARLNYALNDNGFLFLGKAEIMLTHMKLFRQADLKNHVFVKAPQADIRDRMLMITQNNGEEGINGRVGQVRIRDSAFDAGPVAQVIVDANGYLALVNERARIMFGLSTRDVGRPFHDLEISYRPVELRSSIEQAIARNNPVILRDIEVANPTGESTFLDVQVVLLRSNEHDHVGVSVTFLEVTEHKRLQRQLEQSNQELETALEELQSTNEELETTNEELQSTVEELETTNEELQSTNEELETMNEEMQSTNEELETIIDEMTQRANELSQTNLFLESILTSLRGGVIVLDNEMNVEIWNRKSEDLWGLRSEETIGRNIFSLDFGLPLEQLKKPIHQILSGKTESADMQVQATNRRGRQITCDVHCTPLYNPRYEIQGTIIVVEQKGTIEG